MNTCKLCGEPITPPQPRDCGYDITNEQRDWGLHPIGLDL